MGDGRERHPALELKPADGLDRLAFARVEIRDDGGLLHLATIRFGEWRHELPVPPLGSVGIRVRLRSCSLEFRMTGVKMQEPCLWPPAVAATQSTVEIVERRREEEARSGSLHGRGGAAPGGISAAVEATKAREATEAREREIRAEDLRRHVRVERASDSPVWVFEHADGLPVLNQFAAVDLARLEPTGAPDGAGIEAAFGRPDRESVRVDITEAGPALPRLKRRLADIRVRKAVRAAFAAVRSACRLERQEGVGMTDGIVARLERDLRSLFTCESDDVLELARAAGLDPLEDFAGEDLSEFDLRGAFLAGANLVGAILVGADLTSARLARTILRKARIGERWRPFLEAQGADLTDVRWVPEGEVPVTAGTA